MSDIKQNINENADCYSSSAEINDDDFLDKEDDGFEVKKESLWVDVWRRFKRDKKALAGLGILIILVIVAVFADFIAPRMYYEQDLTNRFVRPSLAHPLGTDNFGRDILSRIIFASRISLGVGLASASIAALVGWSMGSLAGYNSGVIDNSIMRVMDILLAIPAILLAIAIASALGTGLFNTVMAISISAIPGFARIARASVLGVKEQEFVEAARAIGAKNYRVLLRHILPNCMAPLIVQFTLTVASSILNAAALSFVGLGVQPPTPEWGAMLSAGRHHIRDHWHLVTFPGVAIMVSIFSLNLFGDGLRDALDPKLKQ